MIFMTVAIFFFPLVANWLAGRWWIGWRRHKLNQIVLAFWLMSLMPVCASTTIPILEVGITAQPYAVAQEVEPSAYQGAVLNWHSGVIRENYPLRASWYDPALGGTNCDHDCTTMASGDKVASWIGGRNGVHAAACPREWGWRHGVRFEIDGTTFECRDTGGWINCYTPGEYDPATRRTATQNYCWVDLLGNWGIPYGSLVQNWNLKG